ncbi:hypothetical protein E2C01_086928 [Portunus trituberculatus]|uniref:Uncharacterized protein n=1 Tax=Portunus trituberculatus TaxID=210409 RepID=A0A5B7JCQ0_PORTR|nr:hypothetical protein [Portunus trituberculatus]
MPQSLGLAVSQPCRRRRRVREGVEADVKRLRMEVKVHPAAVVVTVLCRGLRLLLLLRTRCVGVGRASCVVSAGSRY